MWNNMLTPRVSSAAVVALASLIVAACNRSEVSSENESGPAVEGAAETASEAPRGNAAPRWESGLPDPRSRGDVRRGDVSIPPDPDYVQAMGTEIWCVPGCRLNNNDEGLPIVPQWCTAWSELTPTFFARESDEDGIDDDESVAAITGYEMLNNEGTAIVDYSGPTVFACMRIDLARLTHDTKFAPYYGPNEAQAIDPDSPDLLQICEPGCVLPWDTYGYQVGAAPSEADRPNAPIPDWCARAYDGCEVRSALSDRSTPRNLIWYPPKVCDAGGLAAFCRTIKLSDH